MAAPPTPLAVVEGFLLRARRVLAHSLIREQAVLMQKLHDGTVNVTVTVNKRTGEESHRIKIEYPPEEALESLASRVRPLILSGESIYYEKALNALEELVGSERLNEEIDLPWWHGYWKSVIDANFDTQAYFVVTQSGSVTDRKLMYAWLYGDVLHAKAPRSAVIRDLDINERYHAAAPGIARICDRVIYTHLMLTELLEKGLLVVSPEILTEPVVVSEIVVDRDVRIRTAEVGAPLPDDLSDPDPEVWKTLHETWGELEDDDGAGEEEVGSDGPGAA
ncbi:MAG: hypothetical protein JWQ86_4193 [Mycobacterium sp.]|nr:hypothetical protein [Mycobacterium sp.]